MRILVASLAALATLTVVMGATVARSQRGQADAPSATLALVADAGPQVRLGAELFDLHCSACHGDTGLGFAEALEAFPREERRCTRCHRRANPPQMTMEQMEYNFAFSIGDPPALREAHTLDRFGTALGLYAYLSATMPRPFPASLDEEEYWAITAFLLAANGGHVDGVALGPENAAEVPAPTAP